MACRSDQDENSFGFTAGKRCAHIVFADIQEKSAIELDDDVTDGHVGTLCVAIVGNFRDDIAHPVGTSLDFNAHIPRLVFRHNDGVRGKTIHGVHCLRAIGDVFNPFVVEILQCGLHLLNVVLQILKFRPADKTRLSRVVLVCLEQFARFGIPVATPFRHGCTDHATSTLRHLPSTLRQSYRPLPQCRVLQTHVPFKRCLEIPQPAQQKVVLLGGNQSTLLKCATARPIQMRPRLSRVFFERLVDASGHCCFCRQGRFPRGVLGWDPWWTHQRHCSQHVKHHCRVERDKPENDSTLIITLKRTRCTGSV
eukprot:m.746142 g.746142  ORF g.746142 m.746142 type:complete len:309 (+) comp23133_c0_seq1:955-1881(+)